MRSTRTNESRHPYANNLKQCIWVMTHLNWPQSIRWQKVYNDLSFLTGRDMNKLRKEPIEPSDKELELLHVNLTTIRRKYDEAKQNKINTENSIANLKEEINKYKIFHGEHKDKIGKANTQAEQLEKGLEDKKQQLEIATVDRKVFLHVQHRLKTDKVVYDRRKYDLGKELEYLSKQKNIILKESEEITVEGDRSARIYEKLQQQLDNERLERSMHLENLEAMVNEKQKLVEVGEKRGVEMQEISEKAMQDKDNTEKQWIKTFLTHKFVNKMLREKIEREMEKFRTVEFAFKEIKTATGVSDSRTLIMKYLNKEVVYGDLLGKISENEFRIQYLLSEGEELIKEQKRLESEKEVIDSTKIKQIDLHSDLKEYNQFSQKRTSIVTRSAKLMNWVRKQLVKFKTIDITSSETIESEGSLKELITKFLKLLEASLTLVGDANHNLILEDSAASNILPKDSHKLNRISKLENKQMSGHDQAEEDELVHSQQNEEEEIIDRQREEILRNNEKFMKELKKKQEELKKLLIDKNEKKEKLPKAPEVKKEED